MQRADALEGVLLDNMLATSQAKEYSMIIEPQKPWFRIWMLAALLVITGIAMIKYLPENRIAATAADAVLIAGILALGVDPLMKRDLLRGKHREGFLFTCWDSSIILK